MMILPATPAAPAGPRTARRSRLRPAFTLVEVLVVMAILVIIAGTASVATFKYFELARKRECELKMQKVEQAAKIYFTTYQDYPQDPSQLCNPGPDGSAPLLEGGQTAILDPWGQPFQMTTQQDQFGQTRVVITSNGTNGIPMQWPKN